MNSISDSIRRVINNCDVCIDGNVISKELLMESLNDFLFATIDNKKHNVGMVLHTGSICFDAIILAYAAISNIMYNETMPEDIVSSLNIGDTVIVYDTSGQGERYVFKGFEQIKSLSRDPYAVFEQIKGETRSNTLRLPKHSWSRVVPYFGTSVSMDGRGIKKENGLRNQFLKEIVGMENGAITRSVDTSTVVIMPKDYSNILFNRLSFLFNGKHINYTDLVTVSYYTEGDQVYQYGNNVAKTEPVIKVTSKTSVARKLLLQRHGNRNIGLIVFGDDSLRKGELELPELIDRQSLQYVYLCTGIDSLLAPVYADNTENIALFACTKEMLREFPNKPVDDNQFTRCLCAQSNIIVNKKIEKCSISNSFFGWDDFLKFKRSLKRIKESEYRSDDKDEFVIQSFSLMNLFSTSIFPICELDECIENKEIGIAAVDERIRLLKEYGDTLPDYLRGDIESAISSIKYVYECLYENNPKYDELLRILDEKGNEKIAIVVPKAYYSPVLFKLIRKKADVFSANKFGSDKLYDLIIVPGNVCGSKFDMFKCKSSKNIIVLLYDFEMKKFNIQSRKTKEIFKTYNDKSIYEIVSDDIPDEISVRDETELAEMEEIDSDLNYFIQESIINIAKAYGGSGSRNVTAEISAIAKFDSGEMAFFSKNYGAYVLKEDEKKLRKRK